MSIRISPDPQVHNAEMPDPELNAAGKSRAVREMFAEIAPTYDRINRLLTVNIDMHWRRFTVNKLKDVLSRPDAIALDLCCGTADLTLEIEEHARVIGCDFCHPMLVIGNEKLSAKHARNALLTEGDALHLPFADASFDAVTIAFGLRNLENVQCGLTEIFRVLKPGGRAAILEFSRPVIPVFREAFEFYFNKILPRIGGLISGSRSAYTYLPRSVRNFPDQKGISAMMRAAGFTDVCYHNLLGGVAAVYLGNREI
ncbi:MAG: bifunctional demethylmenaquinone methyltransferase/2-methoxy-6-polyprenyl-1,4-benzoquinol methylase UbiE [Acidobacteria bacterium]|nr:bifunctional demethylmenaquinone methyltransferase/2-methoxy-6-polyprenyl-1,4-benzoquinol methylase UbiE [Acidobacteriota bacterium]MCI0664884.1 bifunctional demethylmenaquinone methyltransferase/2-methoxy-6-polyprenyl-1,4-benzoquinol methylase UbiE [Acidobacteriota bacterium]